ncbi:MAG: SCP2 sterol-binding domain-containing protein [Gammaproteobacteria bacterium]|nr:SCP2 sterol-binding domain-containing protein [Gammaproteobacteria bacterium]MDH5651180.1 SCP2 sterol-binding domain-containing protein [Gammaproteobacteria bacterium]
MTRLVDSLQNFVSTYHAKDDLVKAYDNWSCSIALIASDSDETVSLQIENGKVVDMEHLPEEVDLLITSDSGVLYDILEFRRDPNEPYMFGELTVQGPEEHFMRLDYIMSMLCPH